MLLKICAILSAGLAGAALAAETPAVPNATTGSPAATTVVKVSEQDPEKLICHRETVIGSLIAKKRVCMTQRNWERNAKNAQDNLQELTKPGAFGPNG